MHIYRLCGLCIVFSVTAAVNSLAATKTEPTLAEVCYAQYGATPGFLSPGQGYDPQDPDPKAFRFSPVSQKYVRTARSQPIRYSLTYSIFISDETDFQKIETRSLSSSAHASFGAFSVSPSYAYENTKSSRDSTKSASWVFVAWEIFDELALVDAKLSSDAQKLVSKPEAFRGKYGTKYVARVLRGSEIQVWVTAKTHEYGLSAANSENIGAQLSYALGADVSADAHRAEVVSQLLKEVHLDARIYARGETGTNYLADTATISSYADVAVLKDKVAKAVVKLRSSEPVILAYQTIDASTLDERLATPDWVKARDEHLKSLYKKLLTTETYLDAVRTYQTDTTLTRDVNGKPTDVSKGLDVLSNILEQYRRKIQQAGRQWLTWRKNRPEPSEPATTNAILRSDAILADLLRFDMLKDTNAATVIIPIPGTEEVDEMLLLAEMDQKHPKAISLVLDSVDIKYSENNNHLIIACDVYVDNVHKANLDYDQTQYQNQFKSKSHVTVKQTLHVPLGMNWKKITFVPRSGFPNFPPVQYGREAAVEAANYQTAKQSFDAEFRSDDWKYARDHNIGQIRGIAHWHIEPISP